MSQALHILAKDVRRSWPALLIALVALAAYVYDQPRQWLPRHDFGMLQVLASYLSVLVPFAWIFVTARVVQAESLVGDRQFWVTRPYHWPQLLGSKLLFIVTFLSVPYFIADVLLIDLAGFSPPAYLGGLLWMQLLMLLFVFFPALVLSSVTATMGQMALAIAAIILYTIGMGFLSEAFPHGQWLDRSTTIAAVIFVASGVAIVLSQYARRRTGRARAMLGIAVLAVTIVDYALPDNAAPIIARDYPQSDWQSAPVQLAFDPTPTKEPRIVPGKEKTLMITLPLLVSGVSDKALVHTDGLRLTVTGTDGQHWSSGWHRSGEMILPGQSHLGLAFAVPAKFMGKVQSAPADLQVDFALTALKLSNAQGMTISPGEFPLVGALCSAETFAGRENIQCRIPLHAPRGIAARTESAASTCPPVAELLTPPNAAAWAVTDWTEHSSRAEFGLSPIQQFSFFFRYPEGTVDESQSARLFARVCPGTSVTFFQVQPAGRTHTVLRIPGITLWHYRQSNESGFVGGISFGLRVR